MTVAKIWKWYHSYSHCDLFLSFLFFSLFACLVMASKVWDDLSMWNVVSMAQNRIKEIVTALHCTLLCSALIYFAPILSAVMFFRFHLTPYILISFNSLHFFIIGFLACMSNIRLAARERTRTVHVRGAEISH